MRGVGEGSRPWDRPGSTMTNGTVDKEVTGVEGLGADRQIQGRRAEDRHYAGDHDPAYVVGDKSELKPGAHIATFAAKKPDGSLHDRAHHCRPRRAATLTAPA